MDNLIIGCGYLGQRVADIWLARGERVQATTRRFDGLADATVTPMVCDVLEPRSLGNLPAVDTVVYAIGFDRSSGASMRSVYVDGLANVLARLPRPGKFIYISSSSVYGQNAGEWVDEESLTQPEEESGRIVLAAERVLHANMPDAVILRFAGIYGPGRLLRQKTIEAGEAISADGSRWLNLIHVEDGARAVLAAAEHARPGRIYNIADDQPVARHDFYSALAEHLHAPRPTFVLPDRALPAPPHEKANRRLRNRRMREELKVTLRYPNYLEGIRASLRMM